MIRHWKISDACRYRDCIDQGEQRSEVTQPLMTSRLSVTQAQMRAAAKVAKEFGVSVRLEADGAVVVSQSSAPTGEDEFFDLQHYLQWRDGQQRGTPRAAKSASDDVAAVFAKMDPNSRKVLAEGCLWEWDDFKAHVLSKPLNKREIAALEALAKFGVGRTVSDLQISIGSTTEARLEARGYIEIRPHEKVLISVVTAFSPMRD